MTSLVTPETLESIEAMVIALRGGSPVPLRHVNAVSSALEAEKARLRPLTFLNDGNGRFRVGDGHYLCDVHQQGGSTNLERAWTLVDTGYLALDGKQCDAVYAMLVNALNRIGQKAPRLARAIRGGMSVGRNGARFSRNGPEWQPAIRTREETSSETPRNL